MHDIYDILIVGAGPAGCAAAYDLARAGKRVLLLDKRTFPRPKPCACGLTRKTLKALRYSVDPIIERVCHEIVLQQSASVTAEPHARRPRRTEVRVKTRKPICAMAVRERFDDFCLKQTLASGRLGGSVEFRKIESILALRELPAGRELPEGREVPEGRAVRDSIELDILTAEGPQTLRVPVLIGADGSNGQTRRLAARLYNHGTQLSPSAQVLGARPGFSIRSPSAQDQDDGFALEATVPYAELPATLPAGAAPHDLVFDFAPLHGGYGWLFPKGDHINIGVGAFAPADGASGVALKSVTRALLLGYAKHKLGVATLAHITGQYLGMGGHAYVPRGRVLLVGDAAGLVDPLTGEGIHSAIVSGQAAAAAILSCADGEPAETLAAAYARELRPLQETLAFSQRAARAFYAKPERGFKAMRFPFMRSLILKTYADGLPRTRLITALAKLTT
jgi:flavin-dependent dehydrogenase